MNLNGNSIAFTTRLVLNGIVGSCLLVQAPWAQATAPVTGTIRLVTGDQESPLVNSARGTLLQRPDGSTYLPERVLAIQDGPPGSPLTSARGRMAVNVNEHHGRGLIVEAATESSSHLVSNAVADGRFGVTPVWRLKSSPQPSVNTAVPVILRTYTLVQRSRRPGAGETMAATAIGRWSVRDPIRGELASRTLFRDHTYSTSSSAEGSGGEFNLGFLTEATVALSADISGGIGGIETHVLVESLLRIDPQATFLLNGETVRYDEAYALRFSPEIAAVPIPEPCSLVLCAISTTAALIWLSRTYRWRRLR